MQYYIIEERHHPAEKGYKEGITQGIKEGLEQGIEKGESSLLHRQLESRFGPLPIWAKDKLASANSQTLEHWAIQILVAQTIDDVFK